MFTLFTLNCMFYFVHFKLYLYFVHFKLYVYFEWSLPVTLSLYFQFYFLQWLIAQNVSVAFNNFSDNAVERQVCIKKTTPCI